MLSLHADYTLPEVTDPYIVIIPGGREGTAAAAEDPKILEWVRDVHKRSTFTTSVCTGTFILGAAGLIKDLKVTIHWAAKENLENRFEVTYVPERYVRQGKIITAAGVSAGIDMALYLAKELAGEKYVQAIQLLLEYDPAPSFDTGSEEKAPAEVREFMKTMGS